MAEHSSDRDLPEAEFPAETELLRGANTLPTLSSRFRERVLTAATAAYRKARRWSQARQAASFLSFCLFASFVLSPLASLSLPRPEWGRSASLNPLASPQEPTSAWSLLHDRAFVEAPREGVSESLPTRGTRFQISDFKFQSSDSKSELSKLKSKSSDSSSELIVRAEPSRPRDKLLTALHHSDGWATVQAFQAVRSRSHSTLQRAFAAN
ncbi:MAG: hypothetical protein ACKV2Q_24265 [Planctomycetaceae bacterium]